MLKNRQWLRVLLISSVLVFCVVISALGYRAQEAKPPAAETKPAGLQMPVAHFHHLHLNTLDPKGALKFYTSKFDCEEGKFAGMMDAVWAQKSWLLFTKVDKPPISDLTSSIWHFGWGAEDMKATYEKQLAMGTKFFTPLTD